MMIYRRLGVCIVVMWRYQVNGLQHTSSLLINKVINLMRYVLQQHDGVREFADEGL